VEDILRLKEKRNAVILAHNYQRPEIQDLGDFLGDSLALARQAQTTDADVIVFCGVDFMAETAAIVNPDKTILLPEHTAQCPMAALLKDDVMRKAREEHPEAEVVMYINTRAESKTYADCICTSSNALKVVEAMDADSILFAPDKNLAHYVQERTKKKIIPVPEYGVCAVHNKMSREEVDKVVKAHPNAKLTVHPEVAADIQEIADHVGSTKQMIEYVKENPSKEFIIGTEVGIIHRMKKETPGKQFYPACDTAVCQNMKKINLQNLHESLEKMQYKIEVPEETAEKARAAIQKMLDLP